MADIDPDPEPDPAHSSGDSSGGHSEKDMVPSSSQIAHRAELLPEEQAAGSADPQAQAEAILEESMERTEHPDADASTQSAMHGDA